MKIVFFLIIIIIRPQYINCEERVRAKAKEGQKKRHGVQARTTIPIECNLKGLVFSCSCSEPLPGRSHSLMM